MKNQFLVAFIIFSFITTLSGYSLIGDWSLSKQHMDFASNLTSTNIVFSFTQLINSQNKIINQLTIKTCRVMFYTFTYRQNTIVPVFVRFGQNNRQCVGDQVIQVRRKMESIFYFSIVDNRLILIYPSQKIGFVLVRNNNIVQGIKGKWDAIELNGKPIDKQTIDIGQNRIALCNGKYTLEYQVKPGNKIQIKQPSSQNNNNSECDKKDIINTLKSAQVYARNETQLRLYEGNSSISLKGQKTRQIPNVTKFDKQILHDKWYIYSINGTSLDKQLQKIYYYYFLIITPERFRFYGGCNVQFSYYDFINNNQVNHREVNYVKKPTCRYVNQDTLVLNSLFDHGKIAQYDQNTGILTFYDDNWNNILQFTTVMPQTRDILPGVNF